jgi:uncharacterized damage-inducible protein DinB
MAAALQIRYDGGMPDLHGLFEYDAWANREVIEHLRQMNAPTRALAIIAHIIGTGWLWLGRIHGDGNPAAVWPDLSLDECETQLNELVPQWQRVLAADEPRRNINYTNSKGERWSSTVDDVLMHVIIHGAYHRGQIATIVRTSGTTPAYTDYIHCIRQGFID